jgi:hypothetical protein
MTALIFLQLQKLDSHTDRAQQRLSELQAWLTNRRALVEVELHAQAAQAAAADSRHQLRDRELELKTLETRIVELEQKLYGGRIRNSKELESFEKELRMFKQQQGKLEETVLRLMDVSEQAETALQRAQGMLNALRVEREQQEQGWQSEQAQLTTQLVTMQSQLQTLRAQADPDDLARYDRLRRTRGGLAVATLNGFNCGGCGLGVPSDTVQKARGENTLALCDSCGRILYNA